MKIPATVRAVLVRLGFLRPVTYETIVGSFNKTVADLETFAAEQDAQWEREVETIDDARLRMHDCAFGAAKANRAKAKIVELIG